MKKALKYIKIIAENKSKALETIVLQLVSL